MGSSLWPKLLLTVLIGVTGVCTSALANERVALVIGNGSYQNVAPLLNPANDASDIAASLQRLGFSVTTLINARFDDMRLGLLDFGRKARGVEMAVVFYAGHGMEIGGENWLIPIDAELRTDTDAENEAISLRSVVLQVATATNLGLVILDACRNNPFAANMQRSIRTRAVERGLVQVGPTDNVLVAFSAKDGTVSNDGDGRNSPFTAALLNNIETPGLEINFMFRNVRDDVMTATKREQQPFVYGSLSKEAIYLKPPTSGQTVGPVGAGKQPGRASADVVWTMMKDTKEVEVLRSFVQQYPSDRRVAEAQARIAALIAAPIEVRFNEAKVRALATKQGVPLPETLGVIPPSSTVPKKAVEYLGAWGGAQRWGGGGRQMLLVVTNIDESGSAIGVLSEGPPTPNTFNQNPAHYVAFEGTITDNGLSFAAYRGTWNYRFKIRPDGMMDGQTDGPQNHHPTITIERIN
jgi:Caspase domain